MPSLFKTILSLRWNVKIVHLNYSLITIVLKLNSLYELFVMDWLYLNGDDTFELLVNCSDTKSKMIHMNYLQ